MKRGSQFFLMVICTIILGCATGYQTKGFTGGFSDTQLAPDVFRVSFSGNAYTSEDRVQDFALLRAAELCLENGLPYFTVVDSEDRSRTGTFVTQGSATTSGQATVIGNTATYSGTTTYDPGQVYNFYKPGVGLMVRGFAEKPTNVQTFDAQFLIDSCRDTASSRTRVYHARSSSRSATRWST